MPSTTLRFPAPLAAAAVAVTVAAAACGGSSSPSAPPSLTIQLAPSASGNGQMDTVLSTLPSPLRALVTLGGMAQSGDTVTWATSASAASVSPLKSVTDANGLATTAWMLGHTAGAQTATATLAGAAGSPLAFTATATPGAATQLILPTGDGQAWMVGTVLPQPLTVTIADQYGNGVSGVTVTWQVTSGSASVSPTSAMSSSTGVAQTTVTLGATAGPITITATTTGLSGSPQSFGATAQAVPTTAAVTVGPDIVFTSNRNHGANPAVDTIAAGGTVTWTWATGSIGHSVQSTGTPSFASSLVKASGTYGPLTFPTAGRYQYNCSVHGSAMSGTILVR